MKPILTATRPCEVLCLFPIEFPTQEGDAYCFITLDVFSEFLIQTGTDSNNDIAYVLKHIELLMEHKDFSNRKHRPFTFDSLKTFNSRSEFSINLSGKMADNIFCFKIR